MPTVDTGIHKLRTSYVRKRTPFGTLGGFPSARSILGGGGSLIERGALLSVRSCLATLCYLKQPFAQTRERV